MTDDGIVHKPPCHTCEPAAKIETLRNMEQHRISHGTQKRAYDMHNKLMDHSINPPPILLYALSVTPTPTAI